MRRLYKVQVLFDALPSICNSSTKFILIGVNIAVLLGEFESVKFKNKYIICNKRSFSANQSVKTENTERNIVF